jgi:hypothetical protein
MMHRVWEVANDAWDIWNDKSEDLQNNFLRQYTHTTLPKKPCSFDYLDFFIMGPIINTLNTQTLPLTSCKMMLYSPVMHFQTLYLFLKYLN